MVEDAELPFPESVAASEIHKAGQHGGTGAKFLFGAMGLGAVIQAMAQFRFFATSWEKFIHFSKAAINLRSSGTATGQSGMLLSSPGVSPLHRVGYIIGPKLASLNFSGGLLAWGLFVPSSRTSSARASSRPTHPLTRPRGWAWRTTCGATSSGRWRSRNADERRFHALPDAEEPGAGIGRSIGT